MSPKPPTRQELQSVLLEQRTFAAPAAFAAAAHPNAAELASLHAHAEADPEGFWAAQAREALQWMKPFAQVLDDSAAPNYRWFADGTLNVSANCLDVHLAEHGHRTALIFESESGDVRRLSYRELHAEVCRFADALASLGVGKGDRVILYLPLVPEAIVAMQACARLGAVHSVVFGGFSALSLRDRIADAGARVLVTADGGYRGGHVVELKAAVDKALTGATGIETVVVLRHTGADVPMTLWTRPLVARRRGRPAREFRAGRSGCRASAVPAVHLRLHRQAQGHPALERRLSARREADDALGVRPQAR